MIWMRKMILKSSFILNLCLRSKLLTKGLNIFLKSSFFTLFFFLLLFGKLKKTMNINCKLRKKLKAIWNYTEYTKNKFLKCKMILRNQKSLRFIIINNLKNWNNNLITYTLCWWWRWLLLSEWTCLLC